MTEREAAGCVAILFEIGQDTEAAVLAARRLVEAHPEARQLLQLAAYCEVRLRQARGVGPEEAERLVAIGDEFFAQELRGEWVA